MNFRLAKINDINTLVKFRKQQLIDEGQIPNINIDTELHDYFSSIIESENSIIYIMTKNEKDVAVGGVYFLRYPPSFKNATGQTAYVHSMYTVAEYRGQGMASGILALIIDEVKKRNCKAIRLQATEYGKPVYKKAGFVESDGHMIMRL